MRILRLVLTPIHRQTAGPLGVRARQATASPFALRIVGLTRPRRALSLGLQVPRLPRTHRVVPRGEESLGNTSATGWDRVRGGQPRAASSRASTGAAGARHATAGRASGQLGLGRAGGWSAGSVRLGSEGLAGGNLAARRTRQGKAAEGGKALLRAA